MKNRLGILILGARAPVALDLARRLGAAGHKIVLADSMRFPLGRWSRYVYAYERLASPRFELQVFKDQLKALILEHQIDLCIPTCEEAFYLSKIQEKLPTNSVVADFSLMDRLHNKWTFSQWENTSFHFPKTCLFADFKDWGQIDKYVFKPIYSRFGEETLIHTSRKTLLQKIHDKRAWIAQEKIQGEEYCVYSIWNKGQLLAFSIYKPQYRFQGGASMFFQPIWKEQIFESVKSFGEKIAFHGQLCFDLIEANEKAYVIECNPRATSGLHLFGDKIASSVLFGKEYILRNPQQAYALKSAIFFSNPFHLFRKDVRQSKEVVFSWKDPFPFLMQIFGLLEFLTTSFREKITLTQSMTYGIAYNGRES
ncbi:MAG: ATP-grasp domain-containing protein [Bacteroidota bacterium]